MGDKIDAAIAEAEKPPPVAMMTVEVTISSTKRPAVLMVPVDASDGELAELAGLLLTNVLGQCRANRAKTPAGRIIVPSRMA